MSDQPKLKLKCKNCNEIILPDASFCIGCGLRIKPECCIKCKAALPPKAKFCPECGNPVVVPGSSANNPIGLTDPVTGMELAFIKGGVFMIGDSRDKGAQNEKPAHDVLVPDFFLARTPVTQRQWMEVMKNNPSHFKRGLDCPVELVSWNDAQLFIKKLHDLTGINYRLPTEVEWEYAARSGGKNEIWAGTSDEAQLKDYAWIESNSGGTTQAVAGKKPNGLGLFDMTGNVWEWCSDWYDEKQYSRSSRSNPAGPKSGTSRVSRGGSWSSTPYNLRNTIRCYDAPEVCRSNLGFRLASSV